MASVDFMKLKTAKDIMSMFVHDDKDERLRHDHSNKQIDKELTPYNTQHQLSAKQTYQKYKDRIAHLDETTNTNFKPNRVTLFGLEVPRPKDLPSEKVEEWAADVREIMREKYKEENIIGWYLHRDELHDYRAEGGEVVRSREHLHVYVVPEMDGKLYGKGFSAQKNMRWINREIQKMSLEKYGVQFMDGSKRKSKKTVQQLKNESANREYEADLEMRQTAVKKREESAAKNEAAAAKKRAEIEEMAKIPPKLPEPAAVVPLPKKSKLRGYSDADLLEYGRESQSAGLADVIEQVIPGARLAIKKAEEAEEKIGRLEAENSRKSARINELEYDNEHLKREKAVSDRAYMKVSDQLDDLKTELNSKNHEIEDLKEEVESWKSSFEAIKVMYKDAIAALYEAGKRISQLTARLFDPLQKLKDTIGWKTSFQRDQQDFLDQTITDVMKEAEIDNIQKEPAKDIENYFDYMEI